MHLTFNLNFLQNSTTVWLSDSLPLTWVQSSPVELCCCGVSAGPPQRSSRRRFTSERRPSTSACSASTWYRDRADSEDEVTAARASSTTAQGTLPPLLWPLPVLSFSWPETSANMPKELSAHISSMACKDCSSGFQASLSMGFVFLLLSASLLWLISVWKLSSCSWNAIVAPWESG